MKFDFILVSCFRWRYLLFYRPPSNSSTPSVDEDLDHHSANVLAEIAAAKKLRYAATGFGEVRTTLALVLL